LQESLSDSNLDQGASKNVVVTKADSVPSQGMQKKVKKEPRISNSREDVKDNQPVDLIDFSDLDVMDTGNLGVYSTISKYFRI
jgi:hypothetical protein